MALPEGLHFLNLGWWLIHVVAVWLVVLWGYRRGRGDERRHQRDRERKPRSEKTHDGT